MGQPFWLPALPTFKRKAEPENSDAPAHAQLSAVPIRPSGRKRAAKNFFGARSVRDLLSLNLERAMGIEQIRMNQTKALPPAFQFNWSQMESNLVGQVGPDDYWKAEYLHTEATGPISALIRT